MLQSLFIWELDFSNIVNIIKECPSLCYTVVNFVDTPSSCYRQIFSLQQ